MEKAISQLANVELVKENGAYYLSLEYLLEDDNRVEKLIIPRAKIPIDNDFYPILAHSTPTFSRYFGGGNVSLESGYEGYRFELKAGPDARLFTLETIKEKEHEMTVEEIEKKLGYKVKIVSGGKKK